MQGFFAGFECENNTVVYEPTACGSKPTAALYEFTGDMFAPVVSWHTGKVFDVTYDKVGRVEKAVAAFDPSFDLTNPTTIPASLPWTCRTCRFVFNNGSVLETLRNGDIDPNSSTPDQPAVPLKGRVLTELGPVGQPAPDSMSLRMIGCSGLKETAHQGPYAGKEGSICINGTFTFNPQDPSTAKGGSNCTIVLQDPLKP